MLRTSTTAALLCIWGLAVAAVLLSFGIWAPSAQAITVNTTAVFGSPNDWMGFGFDPVTNKYYRVDNFDGGFFWVYDNHAAFVANTPSASYPQSGGNSLKGTYFAVYNNQTFGHSGSTTTEFSRWSAITGETQTTVPNLPSLCAENGSCGFNWGGYSTVNTIRDGSDIYVLGHESAGGNVSILRIDENLNVLDNQTFGATSLGWGFAVSGKIFTSSNYDSNTIDTVFDIASGTTSSVNYELLGMGSTFYITNAFYDESVDALFLWNFTRHSLYEASNIGVTLGISGTTVPEPSTGMIMAAALLGLSVIRRRKET